MLFVCSYDLQLSERYPSVIQAFFDYLVPVTYPFIEQSRPTITVYLSDEKHLNEYYQRQLSSFIDNTLIAGTWSRSEGIDLHYRYAARQDAKAWVLVMQGRAESVVKYAELLEELYQNGYSVFAFDHVGQGQSSRQGLNPQHGFIESFDRYIEDARHMVESVMHPLKRDHSQAHLPQFVLSHSMGAAIATLLISQSPNLFAKAVISSPMYGILSPIPMWLARLLVKMGVSLHRLLKRQSGYFLGQGDYKTIDFSKNKLTSSETRYRWFKQYYDKEQAARLGGVSYQWLAAALEAMDKVPQSVAQIKIPILMLQAGNDEIVDNQAIDAVFSALTRCNSHARLMTIAGAKHEILFERDTFRKQAMQEILTFFEHGHAAKAK